MGDDIADHKSAAKSGIWRACGYGGQFGLDAPFDVVKNGYFTKNSSIYW